MTILYRTTILSHKNPFHAVLVQHGTLYLPTQHAMMVNTARRVFHTHMESLPLYCKNTEIVAYPQSELYQMIIDTTDYCDVSIRLNTRCSSCSVVVPLQSQ